ncbi:hypothetical protein [Tepidiforma sp.]|uniref:hypothetical protein n=1 Tax=Tepidiforma sp. TaxID=2682230 RepID=UPI002609D834|nr:hypothetical protein [Tepidiforma sp.]MCX7616848.1 hypothetical protein [Tepidiforma sp.]
MRADTSDVAFRLLLALGELWEGLHRAGIDPSARGLHITHEYLGGYTRYCAGPGSHPRLVVEWNESSRHLRVIRCEPWPGVEATISATVALVRAEARARGISDIVDRTLVAACKEPLKPARKTVLPTAMQGNPALAGRRA